MPGGDSCDRGIDALPLLCLWAVTRLVSVVTRLYRDSIKRRRPMNGAGSGLNVSDAFHTSGIRIRFVAAWWLIQDQKAVQAGDDAPPGQLIFLTGVPIPFERSGWFRGVAYCRSLPVLHPPALLGVGRLVFLTGATSSCLARLDAFARLSSFMAVGFLNGRYSLRSNSPPVCP